REVREARDRHRLAGGSGRDADAAHQRVDGALAHAQARSLLAPRSAQARRAPAPVPELPAAEGRRGLPRPHQGARPAPVAPIKEGGSLSELLAPGLTQTSTLQNCWKQQGTVEEYDR